MLTPIYLNGFGLASSLGADLDQALLRAAQPPNPQRRAINGLPHDVPYHAMAHAEPDWTTRCENLLRQVMHEAGHKAGYNAGCNPERTALYIASSSTYVGAMQSGACRFENLRDFVAAVTRMLDWRGPLTLVNSACTSSLTAMMEARKALLEGVIDEALVIGFELENQLSIAGFAGLQLLSATSARPFAATRDGQILGEAVAAVRLSREPARWRLAGGAHVIDSSQLSSASESAYRSMLAQTLAQAKWTAAEVDLIKVQASGSVSNDAVEAHALHGFFTPTACPALVSLKPQLGHTLGAAGAAEIALMLTMLERRQWPRCDVDTESDLHVSLAAHAPRRMKKLLACILGFGGSHACVAIEAAD